MTGSVDVDLSKLTANELMAWGMANLWKEGVEGAYAVRHGRQAVSDFGRPRSGEEVNPNRDNFFEKAFPCLFPYGVGGIEADREVGVGFLEHIRWCLQYNDRRFRRHETFAFVAFGIHQRRQALLSARLQMRRRLYDEEARTMATVTMQKLQKAEEEERQGLLITDPAVRVLQRNVYTAISHIKGSNQSRLQLRTQIWSTCIMKNPANLWITINPTDIHDPIAQIFAGENVDMDSFMACSGPNVDQRAENIAQDPYAAVKFFHFLIHTILETLFGVKVTDFHVYNKVGIFGRVSAYFGTVESQGRGSLHFHLLLWLENSPQAKDIKDMLKSATFRSRVASYIHHNLRAYVPGLETAEATKAIPREADIVYSQPVHPDAIDYEEQVNAFEL